MTWNPGHYVELGHTLDNSSSRTDISNKLALGSAWKGICNFVQWGHLEGAKNDYSKGDAYLDWLFAQANAAGKKIILILDDKKYGGYSPTELNSGLIQPTYLLTSEAYHNPSDPADNNGLYLFSPAGTGSISIAARTWTAPVMDRFIALVQHLGARYGNEPALEAIYYPAMSAGGTAAQNAEAGISVDAIITQVKRFGAAARAAFPTKHVGAMNDWPGTMSKTLELVAWGRAHNFSWGDYDTVDFTGRPYSGIGSSAYAGMRVGSTPTTSGESYGHAAFRGATTNAGPSNPYSTSGPTSSGSGGVDMRGKTAFVEHVQSPDWNRSPDRYGVQSVEEFADIHKFNKATHVCWSPYNWEPTTSGFNPANQADPWTNLIRPMVERNPTIGIHTTYPTDWPQ